MLQNSKGTKDILSYSIACIRYLAVSFDFYHRVHTSFSFFHAIIRSEYIFYEPARTNGIHLQKCEFLNKMEAAKGVLVMIIFQNTSLSILYKQLPCITHVALNCLLCNQVAHSVQVHRFYWM